MTHHPIRTEPDGTRVYSNGTRYKPLSREERKYNWQRPDHPEAVRFHTRWFLPLVLVPDELREMPETRPDDQTLEHRAWCRCAVCSRPAAQKLWEAQMRRGS